MRTAGRQLALGCSGVLGFVAFVVVTLAVLIPGLMIVEDRSALDTWAVIFGAIVLGWLAATRIDRAVRRWLGQRGGREQSGQVPE